MFVFGPFFWDDDWNRYWWSVLWNHIHKNCLTRISISNLIQVVSTKIDLLKGFHLQLPVALIKHGVLGFCWVNNFLSHIGGIKECQYFWCFWVISTLIVHSLGWYTTINFCVITVISSPRLWWVSFIVGFSDRLGLALSNFGRHQRAIQCSPSVAMKIGEGFGMSFGWGWTMFGKGVGISEKQIDFETTWYMISW